MSYGTNCMTHSAAEGLILLREALEECRDAVRDIGGGGEIAEWTGNERYRGILGRVEQALREVNGVPV